MFLPKNRRITQGTFLFLLFAGAFVRLCAGDDQSDWCKIQSPAEVSAGKPFEVSVQVKTVSQPTKLGVDLYWMKANGQFGGFLFYGPREAVDRACTKTFSFTVQPTPEMGSVYAGVILSPDGAYEHKTAEASGPPMAIKGFQKPQKPAGATYQKSWLYVHAPAGPFHSGDSFDVSVEYYLDPADAWGSGTKISLDLLGPWIDAPDGKYETTRHHVPFPGPTYLETAAASGHGTRTFHVKIDQLYPVTSVLLAARFTDANGDAWPWSYIVPGPAFADALPGYELHTAQPGNLFSYDEKVAIQVKFADGTAPGQRKNLRYSFENTRGEKTAGQLEVVTPAAGQTREFALDAKQRGTFLLETEIEGVRRELFFARIPDAKKNVASGPGLFGATDLNTEAESRIAQKLGLRWCRHFVPWKSVEPGPDVWRFDDWDAVFRWNQQCGVTPWVCLVDPPAWVQTGQPPENIGYEPYAFDETAWAASAKAMSQHWRNQIFGWEWQNEIVPGSRVADPVQNYLRFCRIGANAAKGVDARLQSILAGGLWPRNFRAEMLAAGVGESIDILPVHYSDLNGVLDARQDLARLNLHKVAVWDDETGNAISTWKMPALEILQVTSQSRWVLQHWPDELIAGAQRIIAFAGPTDAAGNWSYLVDDATPRPYAATIAVLISKLSGAQPLGKFYLGDRAVFHLFARNGKAVLVAASTDENPVDVALASGAGAFTETDDQGNETSLPPPDANGIAMLHLEAMPVFLEGGDLETLKSYLMLSFGDAQRPVAKPHAAIVRGAHPAVPVNVTNPYDQPIDAEVMIIGQAVTGAQKIRLAPAASAVVSVPLQVTTNANGSMPALLDLRLAASKIRPPEIPFSLDFIDLASLGNLVRNGGFEEPAHDGPPTGWQVGTSIERTPNRANEPGLGGSFLSLQHSAEWMNFYQEIFPAPGQSYLYSAWIRSHGMETAGSNLTMQFQHRKDETLFTPNVFDVGGNTPSWRLVTMRLETPADLKSVVVTPIAKGGGVAAFDNVRFTLYAGTNYAAEIHKVAKPPVLDGRLDGWNKECPIPLLGDNQVTVFDASSYQWTPENLSGVAYLEWDDDALYFAAEVIDDAQVAPFTDERTVEGDSIVLALDPANRTGKGESAFAYYISAASPGGGSGKLTLYRPPAHAGGLPSGQLARDSSVYDVVVKRQGSRTIYQARLPWSQLGMRPAAGKQIGLSLQLNDNDGHGRAACMNWGDGLLHGWDPAQFGAATLLDD